MWGLRILAVAAPALLCATIARGGLNVPPPADSTHPQWLADGHHLVYRGSYLPGPPPESPSSYVAADDGSGFRPATAADAPARPDLARSPDGTRVAYVVNGEIWTSALDGSTPRELTLGAAADADVQPVVWSSDGTQLAYSCCRAMASGPAISVVDADGTHMHRVHRGGAVGWITPTSLAVGLEGYATVIYRVGVDGRDAHPLVTGYYGPGGFAISPDGTQIAFTAYVGWAYDRGGVIYVAATSGLDTDVRLASPTVCSVESKLFSEPGGRCINGTTGPDLLVGSRIGDLILAGPGDDVIRGGGGENIVQAQWGNDTISTGAQIDYIDAGAGRDLIRSGGGNDRVNLGPGRDVVYAGLGNDIIIANDGERDVIGCGPGDDRVRADRIDVTRACEHVAYAPPDPDQR